MTPPVSTLPLQYRYYCRYCAGEEFRTLGLAGCLLLPSRGQKGVLPRALPCQLTAPRHSYRSGRGIVFVWCQTGSDTGVSSLRTSPNPPRPAGELAPKPVFLNPAFAPLKLRGVVVSDPEGLTPPLLSFRKTAHFKSGASL